MSDRLVDAQTNDSRAPAFVKAFDVIRRFNEEVADQERRAQPKGFHLPAVQTWLRLHVNSNDHIAPVGRSVNPARPWIDNDSETLEMLNVYSFRCHGTILFNVLDKQAVLEKRLRITRHLNPTQADLDWCRCYLMPPDRKFDDQKQKLTNLVDALK